MAADRGAALTLRAASRGVIDFRECQIDDVRWWRRTNALIRAMEVSDDVLLAQAALTVQCALLANSGLSIQGLRDSQQAAKNLFFSILNMLQPWAKASPDDMRMKEVQALIEDYKKTFGDPDDPAFRKKLQDDWALHQQKMRERQKSQRAESDEERVDRLIHERQMQQRAVVQQEAQKRAHRRTVRTTGLRPAL